MFINQLTISTWREATPSLRMTVTLALLRRGSRVQKSIFYPSGTKLLEKQAWRSHFRLWKCIRRTFSISKVAMAQRYALQNKDRNSNHFLLREKHWHNFGWGAEIDRDGRKIMVHHPYEVWMRRSFSSEEPWIKVCLLERESTESNVISSPPAQLYQSQIPLKPAKLKDLRKIASQHIPPDHRGFYLCLRREGGESNDDTEYTGSDCSASN